MGHCAEHGISDVYRRSLVYRHFQTTMLCAVKRRWCAGPDLCTYVYTMERVGEKWPQASGMGPNWFYQRPHCASLGRVLLRSAWSDVVVVTGFICERQILLSSSLRWWKSCAWCWRKWLTLRHNAIPRNGETRRHRKFCSLWDSLQETVPCGIRRYEKFWLYCDMRIMLEKHDKYIFVGFLTFTLLG